MYPNFNVWKSTATNTIDSYPQSYGQGSNTKGPRPKKYQDILAVNEVKKICQMNSRKLETKVIGNRKFSQMLTRSFNNLNRILHKIKAIPELTINDL